MFAEIFRFELWYRFRRPATWIYFAIMFLVGFAAISWDGLQVGGGTGLVKDNAPTVIASMMIILTAIPGFFLSSAVMGVPVLRDYEHSTSAMIFTAPIKKGHYLFGRFFGSYVTLIFIFLGLLFGLMLGSLMPWLDEERMLPFNAWHFWQPFFLFVLPNLLFSGALFFMGGTLSKKLLMVFVQGIGLFLLYIIGVNMLRDLESRDLVAILDPIGINLVNVFGRYWSPAEQNTLTYPLAGLILTNRLIWMLVGVVSLAATYFIFSFTTSARSGKKAKKGKAAPGLTTGAIPTVSVQQGMGIHVRRILALSRLYFTEIVRSVPFLAIVLFGMVMLFTGVAQMDSMYGTDVFPNTFLLLDQISTFNLFFIIIIVFYSGELIWRERDVKMNLIYDALPMPDSISLLSKFLGMMVVHVAVLTFLMLSGILIQAVKGFFRFQIDVYIGTLFGETLVFLALFTILGLFIHVMVNQKFLGHAVIILFFIVTEVLAQVGLEHSMFSFASGSLGTLSEMNGFGHYVPRFSWYQLYWTGFAALLFSLGITFSVRGTDTMLKTRAKLARQRWVRPLLVTVGAAFVLFASSGFFIFYNTTVVNEYQTSDEVEEYRTQYELTLKQFQDIPQPKIVETEVTVDIFPYRRDLTAGGYYILKNKSTVAIEDIHIQNALNPNGIKTSGISFTIMDSVGGSAEVKEIFEDYGYTIYRLDHALQPGDSVKMDWQIDFITEGFVEGGTNTNVVFNGTFINNSYFPALGYDNGIELSDDDTRREKELPERERARERTDSVGLHINLVGDDADFMRFAITMGTSEDQIAIAPGYLQKEWEEDGRKYYRYEMDQPMFNFYAMVSARYEVVEEAWEAPFGETIKLQVFHHIDHTYNVDRMMEAMKHSLTYYSEHFGPYQHKQMRILEFPRYASFAQSFANTVPFSESIGFILDIDEDDVDIAYYVTAHEMAHQWWGHQVCEAQVKGSAMLSETMSQYSALMVMKEKYPQEMMQKFLRYELDSYLGGRARESKKEQPLELVEGQGYIHYRKGSLVMYALQDYIGEDSVNAALARYVEDWAFRDDIYPTSEDLIGYFEAVTPDSLQYLIDDMFRTITFFENKADSATYVKTDEDTYLVSLQLESEKIRADSTGNERMITLGDWIDVGIYGQSATGKDSLLYLEKVQITEPRTNLEIEVGALPHRAGIDPLNKLIDRNPGDNVMAVTTRSL